MKIKALITLHFDGKTVKPGTVINLDDKEAKALVARGFASTDGLSAEDTTPAVETDNGPSLEDVIEVIEMLDPEKDFNKDGTPSVEVIESLLEANITADIRNKAWEQFQKDHEANAS